MLPLHPRTRNILSERGIDLSGVNGLHILEPVGYLDMVALEANAGVILTDSGGIQKEAYFARVPCITLRDETEWKELVKSGYNALCGADYDRIIKGYNKQMKRKLTFREKFYGKGKASQKIVSEIRKI